MLTTCVDNVSDHVGVLAEEENTAEIGFYGTEYNLNDALWLCQNMFARVRTKVGR